MTKELVFDEKTHSYYLTDGTKLIGVNELLSLFQNPFYAENIARNIAKTQNKNYKDILSEWKESAKFGQEIHEFAYNIINNINQNKVYEPKFYSYCNSVLVWLYNKNINFVSEKKIFNENYRIAGTIDLHNYIDIYDWKTNKAIETNSYGKKMKFFDYIDDSTFNKYCFQLSMYKKIMELNGLKFNKMYLLHIEQFKVNEIECSDFTEECSIILALWKISGFDKEKLKKLIEQFPIIEKVKK